MTPSLERSPTKAKEVPSPYKVRLTPLDTNPVLQCLGDKEEYLEFTKKALNFDIRKKTGDLFRIRLNVV